MRIMLMDVQMFSYRQILAVQDKAVHCHIAPLKELP